MSVPMSPNMNLLLPIVGTTVGPDWALDINADLATLDQHNHASGNGVQIGSAGLNIDADLPINGYNLTLLRSVRMSAQGSPLAAASDLGCLYVSGVDLYYNDENGNQIRITASGGVAGSPGSIGSLVAPASVTYVSATPAFVFQSDVSTAANLDAGSLTIREVAANAKGISLISPTALAADYSITLLSALPASSKIVRLDNTGVLSASLDVDNTTIQISANNLNVITVPDDAITTAKIAAGAVTDAKIQNDPTFDGSSIGIGAGGNRLYYQNSTFSVGTSPANSLLLGYNAAGTGYRMLSGKANSSGPITAGEGCTITNISAGRCKITPTVAGSGATIIGLANVFDPSGLITSTVSADGTGVTFDFWLQTATANVRTHADCDFYFILMVPV